MFPTNILRSLAAAVAASSLLVPAAQAKELKIVATFSIIADLAANVGGSNVKITSLVGPNGDAHVYEPKPADTVAIAAADVVLVNGLQFEGFLDRLVKASGTKARVVTLSEGAKVMASADDEDHAHHGHDSHAKGATKDEHAHHHHGATDPHAWQSVPNARVYVKNIADALCRADAEGCPTYRANAASYDKKLADVDAQVRSAIAQIPANRRTLISSHDAFGYFAAEYGLKFLAPQGVSTESEASASDVAKLIRQVKSTQASAIFIENFGNPRLVQQIARETGMKVGGALYSDSLSDKSGPASTYIAMMQHNVATIRAAILGARADTGRATR
ncbi:MAG: metal ABC transporter substrate-binding protein [Rhodocyclaceae bacterium]